MDRVLAILRAQLGIELVDRLLVDFAEEYLGAQMMGLALVVEEPDHTVGVNLDRTPSLAAGPGLLVGESQPSGAGDRLVDALCASLAGALLLTGG